MAEYNLICVNCGCGPHKNHACSECGCKEWLRPDIEAVRRIAIFNNNILPILQDMQFQISSLVELMSFAYPEAKEKLDDKMKQLAADYMKRQEDARKERLEAIDRQYREATEEEGVEELGPLTKFPPPPSV